jgi:hypothetical protein
VIIYQITLARISQRVTFCAVTGTDIACLWGPVMALGTGDVSLARMQVAYLMTGKTIINMAIVWRCGCGCRTRRSGGSAVLSAHRMAGAACIAVSVNQIALARFANGMTHDALISLHIAFLRRAGMAV